MAILLEAWDLMELVPKDGARFKVCPRPFIPGELNESDLLIACAVRPRAPATGAGDEAGTRADIMVAERRNLGAL